MPQEDTKTPYTILDPVCYIVHHAPRPDAKVEQRHEENFYATTNGTRTTGNQEVSV